MLEKNNCSVYIDEAGDLGINRGTKWFVLSGVIVDRAEEKELRKRIKGIKSKLNINTIHFRKLRNFEQKCYVVRELDKEHFQYINIIIDTSKIKLQKKNPKINPSILTYNYACRLLIERASWLLRDTNRIGEIVLSSRGTSRDKELIQYLKNELISYDNNEIANVFTKVSSKSAAEWDMLQLADVCATTTFHCYEPNFYGFITPCYLLRLKDHLYQYNNKIKNYGIKYYSREMMPTADYFPEKMICKKRTPSATTTCQACW